MSRLPSQDLIEYIEQGDTLEASDGACLFRPGDEGRAFLIVKSGTVRVEQTNSAGRTVVLYRVEAGDSCVLTTTCLLSGKPYSGYGYAEGHVSASAISADRFRSLLSSDPRFQELVFRGFADRVGELTDVIDDLLEHRTDFRLARWLAARGVADVRMTQQEMAQELGTAREVVSRTLKLFESRGWISLRRGAITITNPAALAVYGSDHTL
ncbi:Crp/Fnr family transcriptional regulator [Roseobacter sp.]|uniref:Crp/Fnr family transcriptional regulator n=1 Tax=Roseobacter sp. TaxID=1907202 RepID=UPI00385C2B72